LTEQKTHGTRWGMRILLFVLTTVFAATALCAQPVAGVLAQEGTQLFISGDMFCSRYLVAAKSNEVLAHIKKLNPGDEITASGDKNFIDCSVVLESIDYVGLRRLLGMWLSNEALIKVKDFSSLSFYPLERSSSLGQHVNNYGLTSTSEVATAVDYTYSLTPSEGKEWVLFLSDSTKTLFATISLSKGSAVMKIYDSESGVVLKTLRMTKWGGVRQ
jgi:hypothetical protein